jgi:ABC-type antimicrobial peptide transport system permease subunit
MIASLLFEMKANDATTIGEVSALICVVALAAGYVPSGRAARLEPVKALRSE